MPRSAFPRLLDIVAASERIRRVIGQITEAAFKADWQQQWLVERGIEIISEASRHLPEALKSAIRRSLGALSPTSATYCVTPTNKQPPPCCGSWSSKIRRNANEPAGRNSGVRARS